MPSFHLTPGQFISLPAWPYQHPSREPTRWLADTVCQLFSCWQENINELWLELCTYFLWVWLGWLSPLGTGSEHTHKIKCMELLSEAWVLLRGSASAATYYSLNIILLLTIFTNFSKPREQAAKQWVKVGASFTSWVANETLTVSLWTGLPQMLEKALFA